MTAAAAITTLLPLDRGLYGGASLWFDISSGDWHGGGLRGPVVPPEARFIAALADLRIGYAQRGGRRCMVLDWSPLSASPPSMPPAPPSGKWKRAMLLPLVDSAGAVLTFVAYTSNTADCIKQLLDASAERLATPEACVPEIVLTDRRRPLRDVCPGLELEPGDPEWLYLPAVAIVGWASPVAIDAVKRRWEKRKPPPYR
jgi:hypothetical protein